MWFCALARAARLLMRMRASIGIFATVRNYALCDRYQHYCASQPRKTHSTGDRAHAYRESDNTCRAYGAGNGALLKNMALQTLGSQTGSKVAITRFYFLAHGDLAEDH